LVALDPKIIASLVGLSLEAGTDTPWAVLRDVLRIYNHGSQKKLKTQFW
jgi:hypothetical protein